MSNEESTVSSTNSGDVSDEAEMTRGTLHGIDGFLTNKWVLVRSHNEGVNFGQVIYADEYSITIRYARRLWFYRPKDPNQSWYEGVANTGVSEESKLSPITKMKAIVEPYSATVCSEEAISNLKAHPSHKQQVR